MPFIRGIHAAPRTYTASPRPHYLLKAGGALCCWYATPQPLNAPDPFKHITEHSGSLVWTDNLTFVPFFEDYTLLPCQILPTLVPYLEHTSVPACVLPLLWTRSTKYGHGCELAWQQ